MSTWRGVFIRTAFPCVTSVLLIGLYDFGLFPERALVAINVLCLALAFAELLQGITEDINKRKEACFGAGLFICIATFSFNAPSDFSLFEFTTWNILSRWSLAFAALLVPFTVCFVVVGVRLLRWTQEQWTEMKRLRQEDRIQRKRNARINTEDRYRYRKQVQGQQRFFRKRSEESRWESRISHNKFKRSNDLAMQALRKQSRLETQRLKQDIKREKLQKRKESFTSQKNTPSKDNPALIMRYWNILLALEIIIAIFGFFLIPVFLGNAASTSQESTKTDKTRASWAETVVWIVEKFVPLDMDDSSPQNAIEASLASSNLPNIVQVGGSETAPEQSQFSSRFQKAILYYFFFYSFAAFLLFGMLNFVLRLLFSKNGNPSAGGFSGLILKYHPSIAVLLVSVSGLFVLTGGSFRIDKFSSGTNTLFVAIFFLLVTLVSVEIVSLVLEQCAQPNSLLKKLVRLIFVSILDTLSNILLGIITSIDLQLTISSITSLVFPEAKTDIHEQINRVLAELFRKDLKEISDSADAKQGDITQVGIMHRTHIWRR